MKIGDRVYLNRPPPGLSWGRNDIYADRVYEIVNLDGGSIIIRLLDTPGASSWWTQPNSTYVRPDTDDPNSEW